VSAARRGTAINTNVISKAARAGVALITVNRSLTCAVSCHVIPSSFLMRQATHVFLGSAEFTFTRQPSLWNGVAGAAVACSPRSLCARAAAAMQHALPAAACRQRVRCVRPACAELRGAHARPRLAPARTRGRPGGARLRCAAGAHELAAAAAPLLVAGDLSTLLFTLGQQADALVNANLSTVTPATYAVVLVRARAAPAAPRTYTHGARVSVPSAVGGACLTARLPPRRRARGC
jgi:hypothetical protein